MLRHWMSGRIYFLSLSLGACDYHVSLCSGIKISLSVRWTMRKCLVQTPDVTCSAFHSTIISFISNICDEETDRDRKSWCKSTCASECGLSSWHSTTHPCIWVTALAATYFECIFLNYSSNLDHYFFSIFLFSKEIGQRTFRAPSDNRAE